MIKSELVKGFLNQVSNLRYSRSLHDTIEDQKIEIEYLANANKLAEDEIERLTNLLRQTCVELEALRGDVWHKCFEALWNVTSNVENISKEDYVPCDRCGEIHHGKCK